MRHDHNVAWKPSAAGQGLNGPQQTFSASHWPAWLLEQDGGEQAWNLGQPAAARLNTGQSNQGGCGKAGQGRKRPSPVWIRGLL